MHKINIAFFYTLLLFLSACNGTNCDQLPSKYSSYDEAVKIITTADYHLKETVNTSKSSWVRGASYFSCNGETGFFILKTDNHDYLYSGVPKEIWQGFKNSESFGSFYNHNIKNHYTFNLNQ